MKRIFIWMILLAAMGCTRKVYVPVESVRMEYKDRVNTVEVRDSVTDTRLIYIQGDTVVDWRDRVRWRDREVHDTVLEIVHDSVPVTYTVEKRLSKWERTKMDFGGAAIGAVGICVLLGILWIIVKFRR